MTYLFCMSAEAACTARLAFWLLLWPAQSAGPRWIQEYRCWEPQLLSSLLIEAGICASSEISLRSLQVRHGRHATVNDARLTARLTPSGGLKAYQRSLFTSP